MDSNQSKKALILGALGIIFGDLGTSPLYTLKACLQGNAAPEHVIGVVSLIFWLLMAVVSYQYVALVLRADYRGEGGALSLVRLALDKCGQCKWIGITALFGVAMFYGDSLITPSISVLSAIEGIKLVSPAFDAYVLPVAVATVVGLFILQARGALSLGKMFGPIMAAWFLVIGVNGTVQILHTPQILEALNPWFAIKFAAGEPVATFFVLGTAVLAVTGAEALYADLGHFGKGTIRRAWFYVVAPALTMCYLGQGALMLNNPAALVNPFFLSAPTWALIPMVGLATLATIIASQACITGAFSMTKQAITMNFLPALRQTRNYVPVVNCLLMIGAVAIIVTFRTSDNMSGAYGAAVTGSMLTTGILATFVLRKTGFIGSVLTLIVSAPLLALDMFLFSSSVLKFDSGAWFPLILGLTIFSFMLRYHHHHEKSN